MQVKRGISINLPANAKVRGVEKLNGGSVEVVYTIDIQISRPDPLKGGTYPYQKEGSPYWYCRIKDGRDEFMHIPTWDLQYSDVLWDPFIEEVRGECKAKVEEFLDNIVEAMNYKTEAGIWIPVYEPSPSTDGGLQFVELQEPLVGIGCKDWEWLFKEYSPENESTMLTKGEYFLILLRWIKDGLCNVRDVIQNSKKIGLFSDSVNSASGIELTGNHEFGGVYGLVGNTRKIVKESKSINSGFMFFGGPYYRSGEYYSASTFDRDIYFNGQGKRKMYGGCSASLFKALLAKVYFFFCKQPKDERFLDESVALICLKK